MPPGASIDDYLDALRLRRHPVRARTAIRSRAGLQKLRMVVENYRRWRREREAEP
ncbi:MAG: hypothetical protein ABFC89_11035 [Methanospirillum sp.]